MAGKNSIYKHVKTASIFGGFLVLLGGALYPIIVHPMQNPEYYQEIQKETRKGINQEDIQPGNMRVWRDPFDRRKKEE